MGLAPDAVRADSSGQVRIGTSHSGADLGPWVSKAPEHGGLRSSLQDHAVPECVGEVEGCVRATKKDHTNEQKKPHVAF